MTNITNQNAETAKPQPVAKFRIGPVHAAIWANKTAKGTFFGATYERRYRDSEDNYQSSQTYDGNASLSLSKAADLAHTKIIALEAAAKQAAEAAKDA